MALRLQTVSAQLKENRAQLESAEKTYQELVRAREVSMRAAQDKIEALKFGLSDLKIKNATAGTQRDGRRDDPEDRRFGRHPWAA